MIYDYTMWFGWVRAEAEEEIWMLLSYAAVETGSALGRERCPSCDPLDCAGNPISLSNDLDQRPFSPAAVEFPVEDLFPGAEIQFALRYRYDNFSTHDLALHMRIGVVFPCSIVTVLTGRCVRREGFQPIVVVLM